MQSLPLLRSLLEVSLLVTAIVLLIPTLVFFVECIMALLPLRKLHSQKGEYQPKIAVLMPAHNEAVGIAATLQSLLPELATPEQLIVIADNCTDETAAIARSAGATVLERQNQQQRGKGYALDFGLQALDHDPPDVAVIVDADCQVSPGSIQRIANLSMSSQRPVQAVYLLAQPAQPKPKHRISALAFTVKNLVRPIGLFQMGQPCLLTGTGMAFPWSVLRQVSLASGNIVEDMQLGLDLAIAGHPPLLCAEARVTSALPQQDQAAKTQRTRWEHGHLQTLLTQVPRLLKTAVRKGRFNLLAIALDLSVPPLSLLVMLWLATTLVTACLWAIGISALPLILLVIEGLLIFTAVFAAWAKFCRSELPLGSLLSIPLYVLWKIPLYLGFLLKPQTKWIRTERDAVKSAKSKAS